jgi:thiamine kinase-like enzyme
MSDERARVLALDRTVELTAARAAAAAGLAPEVLAADPAAGVLVTRFVRARPLTTEDLLAPGGTERFAGLLADLHRAPRPGPVTTTDLAAVADRYLARAAESDLALPDGHLAARPSVTRTLAILGRRTVTPVPGHRDPGPPNVLDDGTRWWLIDFEYASWCEPALELADAALLAELDEDATARLCAAYAAARPDLDAGEVAPDRVRAYRAVAEWTWALWGVVVGGITGRTDVTAWAHGASARALAALPAAATGAG